MKVLQIHNYYRTSAPSGEDEVVRTERKLLSDHGIEVIPFERHNDDLGEGAAASMSAAMSNLWSRQARSDLESLIRARRPDVAHFHNTFPQISFSGYAACADAGLPIVQTLHNFRMICANGLMQRGGAPCDDCLGRMPWRAVVHRCYRDSRLASAGISLATATHSLLGTQRRYVARFIALTQFAAEKYVAAGIPRELLVVRGNSLADDPGMGNGSGNYVLYVGRLTREKGLLSLIDAWRSCTDIKLLVVGDGELRPELERRAEGLPVEFLGRQPVAEVLQLMRSAALLVIPSEWYEGFPRVLVEAMATGTPVVASRLGGLAELLADGAIGEGFTAGDPRELAAAIRRLHSNPERLLHARAAARLRYEAAYQPASALRSLLDVYRSVMKPAPGPIVPGAPPAPAELPPTPTQRRLPAKIAAADPTNAAPLR